VFVKQTGRLSIEVSSLAARRAIHAMAPSQIDHTVTQGLQIRRARSIPNLREDL